MVKRVKWEENPEIADETSVIVSNHMLWNVHRDMLRRILGWLSVDSELPDILLNAQGWRFLEDGLQLGQLFIIELPQPC